MADGAQTSRVDFRRLAHACSSCSLAELCLPLGLPKVDIDRLDDVVDTIGPLHGGDHLFRVGDEFRSLYAVRSGMVKTYVIDEDGHERVLGFHLPGELVGFDAIYPNHHECNAVALDTAMACRLPYHELSSLATEVPSLQRQLFRLMSKDISESHAVPVELPADARMANFLMSLSNRLHSRGYSASHFVLAMPRRDIANYLNLAIETVSRILSRFQEQELVKIDRREIRILDRERLHALCRHHSNR